MLHVEVMNKEDDILKALAEVLTRLDRIEQRLDRVEQKVDVLGGALLSPYERAQHQFAALVVKADGRPR